MATRLTPAMRADLTYSVPVPQDRFARQSERSQRPSPAMRKYEIACLHPDGVARNSHHLAPASALFESTSTAFARGTLIATPTGPMAIEDLWPGDLVETMDGNAQTVRWIGSTTFVPAQAGAASTLTHLTRVLADGHGGAHDLGDILLGPAARLLQSRAALEHSLGVRAVLTPAQDLEDGSHLVAVTPPSPVRLYHLRLETHAVVFAGGHPVETYHPGTGLADQMGDATCALFLSLFPDVANLEDFGRLNYPRMAQATLESLIS